MELGINNKAKRKDSMKEKITAENLRMPGGFCWHVHHLSLIEWCWSKRDRLRYIKKNKSARELATRRRLLQFVKRPYPKWLADAERVTRRRFINLMNQWGVATESYQLHSAEFSSVAEMVLKFPRYRKRVRRLHEKECGKHRRCTWDGETIFPDKDNGF